MHGCALFFFCFFVLAVCGCTSSFVVGSLRVRFLLVLHVVGFVVVVVVTQPGTSQDYVALVHGGFAPERQQGFFPPILEHQRLKQEDARPRIMQ